MPLPFISPAFTDHMVLQRDRIDHIWGWTDPGAPVHLVIGNATITINEKTVAGKDGKWIIGFKAPPVGGPYTIKVSGSKVAELKDILIGDVWLCSGQSNMEMGIHDTLNGPQEIAAANHPNIRLFLADKKVGYSPLPTLGGTWKVCSPKSIAEGGWGGFSAAAYHFGVELNQSLRVPIGLVQIAWGGSAGEAWVAPQILAPMKEFDTNLKIVLDLKKQGYSDISCIAEAWVALNDPGSVGHFEKRTALDSGARSVQFPTNNSVLGAPKNEGVGWYCCPFEAHGVAGKGGVIHLGNVNATDRVYINGQSVGSGGWEWERSYAIAPGILREGINTVMVRLVTVDEAGGFLAKPEAAKVAIDGTPAPIGLDQWTGQLTCDFSKSHPNDMSPAPNLPGVLFDGMVAPLAGMAVRGTIWYQGETNVGRAPQYERILAALMANWRQEFKNPVMPFYVVSLASFLDRSDTPTDFSWAEFRASQAKVALADPHSGIALTIDIGDAHDIHPKDKKTLGHRLAVQALANEYGQKIEFSGPLFQKMVVDGPQVVLTFTHADGMFLKSDEHCFAVAGEDRKWHWAKASLSGQEIRLSCPEVTKPVAVRYAWQSNPAAPLYNHAQLPAVPFRTDQW